MAHKFKIGDILILQNIEIYERYSYKLIKIIDIIKTENGAWAYRYEIVDEHIDSYMIGQRSTDSVMYVEDRYKLWVPITVIWRELNA